MIKLAKGTIERLYVDVDDRNGAITTLENIPLTFDVVSETGEVKINDSPCTFSNMTAECFINTSVGTWETGDYNLWVSMVVGAETIRLGPLTFTVV